MSKIPPKYFIQKQVCCDIPLDWIDCGHRAGIPCPDCSGGGGWWKECSKCGEQPYKIEELLKE